MEGEAAMWEVAMRRLGSHVSTAEPLRSSESTGGEMVGLQRAREEVHDAAG